MSTPTIDPSPDLGISKIAAVIGLPIANYLIAFADLELPHPLTPTLEDGVRIVVVGALIWLVPHDALSRIGALFSAAMKAK